MEESEDDVVEVSCDNALKEQVQAKLKEIRSFVPFIQSVRANYQKSLSDLQGNRLDSLVGLLQRENVSMSTLTKIERIIEKLKNRFDPKIPGEVIEITDHSESNATTTSSAKPKPGTRPLPQQRTKPSHTRSKLNGLAILSPAATKPSPTPEALVADCKTIRSPIPGAAASKANKAIPNPERSSDLAKISGFGSGSFTTSSTNKMSESAAQNRAPLKAPLAILKYKPQPDDEQKPATELLAPTQAPAQVQHQDTKQHAIPEPAPSALDKKRGSVYSSSLNRGVLAAMQEARMEEKKQRANTHHTSPSSAKESFARASPEKDFWRRSYPEAVEFTRRLPEKPVQPADMPDFVRRSTPPVPFPVLEASSRQDDCVVPATLWESPSLEEARKKLAALRGGGTGAVAGGVQEMPPLASNINDPRGKKNLSLNLPTPVTNNINNNSINFPLMTPAPRVRTPSPIPPPPSMKRGTWAAFSSSPLKIGFNDPRVSHQNSESPVDPRVQREASMEVRPLINGSEPREQPRDPRIWQNKQSHSHHQQQPPPAQYPSDPRRASSVYSGFEDAANSWQCSNNNVNGNGSAFNKSSWSGIPNGSGSNARGFANQNGSENAGGFNGSQSFRGVYRGGHNSRGFGNSGPRFDRTHDVPRTYGEHRKAKARAEAEAKAKAAEEERQFIADIQRKLDAEEKRKLLAAEAQRKMKEIEAASASSPVMPTPELDTSYRTVTLGPLTKKLDFRIPKKTPPAPAAAPTTPALNGEGDSLSSSSNSSTTKSCDAKKDKDNDKNKDRHLDKAKDKEKDKVEKGKDKSESSLEKSNKHHKSLDKKTEKEKNKSAKKEKKRLEKEREKKSRVGDKTREFADMESVISVNSSENTDNLENEPPVSEANSSPVPELAPGTPDIHSSIPPAVVEAKHPEEDEDEDVLAKLDRAKKAALEKAAEEGPAKENSKDIGPENVADEAKEDALDEDDKPPKLSKLKIVLGPNAHTLMVNPDEGSLEKEAKVTDNKPIGEDDHDDEEVPGPSPQLLRRIMQRRNSMAPTASKPLVDKADIFTPSLLYEDLQEQKRKSQNARSLANMFEKTNDNCTVSTQNIISGKRRTRGVEASFNETQLSRSCFGLGQINRSRTKATDGDAGRAKTPAPDSTKHAEDSLGVHDHVDGPNPIRGPNRKRRRQTISKDTSDKPVGRKKARLESIEVKDADISVKQPSEDNEEVIIMDVDENSFAPAAPVTVIQPPPKPRAKPRKKRNELDKLNEDIAQMYYGEEVLRATGRRACTRRSRTPSQTRSSSQRSRTPSLSRVSPAPDSISSVSLGSPIFTRNMARRGKPFSPRSRSSGINRTTFKAKTLPKPKRCQVRIQRCAALEELLKNQDDQEQKPAKKRKKKEREVRNTNPEWHAKSKAAIKCVVCSKPVRRSPLCHYLLNHEEHYASRLPPGVLEDLRLGRGNRPDYWISQRHYNMLHFTCPFCQKPLLLNRLSLGEHLSAHMGEPRHQCSHCHFPQNRLIRLQAHTATCGPGAKPLSYPDNCRLPMTVHVCHLCQFVQQNKGNMDRHLMQQHGLTKEQLKSVEREELMLCSLKDVPTAESHEEATAILQENEDITSEPSTSAAAKVPTTNKVPSTPKVSKGTKKGKQLKKIKIRFKNMAKKSVRLVKREREEKEEQEREREEQEEQQEQEAEENREQQREVTKMEVDHDMGRLPQPPPEKEPVLVVNECLADVEMESEPEEEVDEGHAIKNKSLMVDEKPVVLPGLGTDLVAAEPSGVEPEPTVLEPEKATPAPMDDEDADVDVEQLTPPRPNSVTNSSAEEIRAVTLAELAGDVLDGIGSDCSDVEVNEEPEPGGTNGEKEHDADSNDDDGDKAKAPTDEWVDLKTAKRNSKGSSKSIFQKFNRFCSRLNKAARSGGKSVASNGSQSSECSHDMPDPSELMPRMRPLEPEPVTERMVPVPVSPASALAAALVATPEAASASYTVRLKSPPKRVENVAFRKSLSEGDESQQASYFCVRPGCTFLFSNELEGLENHFALEHPLVRWSGKCAICPELKGSETLLSIREELRHMRYEHMVVKSAPTLIPPAIEEPVLVLPETEPIAAPNPNPEPAPAPVLPKLRVRRFTGDRLVEQLADDNQTKAAVDPSNTQALFNGMLRGLLAADSRPPSQQVDFNAAGLGEFLSAKPTSPPKEPAPEEQPLIINYQSGLGLSISNVYSRAQMTADSVLSPAMKEPHPDQVAPVQRKRFCCMATGCNFTAHKVMFVREHMKFHRYSFTSSGYLKCAYCSHVAVDVDDYLRHGVMIHDLAPRSDLENGSRSPSVSQQIRDMLSQRSTAPGGGSPATANTTSTEQSDPATTGNPEAGGSGWGAAVGSNGFVSVSVAITDLLRPTGYSDRLYACPQKGCIVRLTEEQFVNHLRYHIRSTHQGSEQVKCKYCTQLMQPPALRTHLQQAHARHSIFCGVCLATAVNKRLMLFHVRKEHPEAYELVKRQLQFIPLRMKPDAVAKGTVEIECCVAAVEQPFGAYQMHNFQRKLFEELELRKTGTKTNFRCSEVRLLPRTAIFPRELRCAECSFTTTVRSTMQMHLYAHKEAAIRQAYQTEESAIVVETTGPTAAPQHEPALDSEELAAGSQAALPQRDLAIPPIPGKHKVFKPPYKYVPSEVRFHCGFVHCGQRFNSELVLRQHMIMQHKYSQLIYCPHCKMRPGQVSVEKYLAHLLTHKRHVYQCGACNRHNSKRVGIERHIQDRHYNQNVDVVVHRHMDYGKTITSRWLKTPKLARQAIMEYTCNLCQQYFPTALQIMAHAASVHKRSHQYHCPYCVYGGNAATFIIDHIRSEHSGKVVQPVQIYQRIVSKNKQTLGFYCSLCRESASNLQKITAHCEEKHKSRFMWKCPHCDVGHLNERHVAMHIAEAHPLEIGLSVIQYEKVLNEMPDDLSWALAQPIATQTDEEEVEEDQLPEQLPERDTFLPVGPGRMSGDKQLPEPHIVTEVVDLLASDDESEELGESPDESKIVEFACTHCDETYSNLQDLRIKHWAVVHPEQPFYFRVQPQLLCSECKNFKGNAKDLREEHLLKVHSIRNIVAADIRRPAECAYCDYRYKDWQDLAQHISRMGHLPNDLKHVTNEELNALMLLSASGSGGAINEYYQCGLCSVVMPTKATIGQHGQVQHSNPGERFCFRQLKADVIYHCFFCMFTSTDELTTLRHMVDHYSRFKVCHFCTLAQDGGFDEYIQHCYDIHRDDVHRFRAVHSFGDLKKFLMQVHYQFQNGLIITKSSLRYTRYNDDAMIRKLDEELMAKAQRPPIPRLHIRLKSTGVQGPAEVEVTVLEPTQSTRIAKRRKTLNPDELLRIFRQEERAQQQQERQQLVVPNDRMATVPPGLVRPPIASRSALGSPPIVSLVGNQVRILKRRNSHVVRSGP
ncbi:uncharacterized protein LOC108023332 isoform X2 [Drosophila biarmipes]|uniref:uncharacterized protein LOC108023332 isoform X2 n=1 Tax=Drosophila biarmipes TaxID=125945 RepID=UPI0021CCAF9B|nr:uncharacterized protein LOC108023332 isoform X2 [Drosophila biarmipes]